MRGFNPRRVDLWKKVIRALDEAAPFYDDVNSSISFGRIQKWREWSVEGFCFNGMVVLDAGFGLGNMSATAGRKANLGLVLGLDFSAKVLTEAREEGRLTLPKPLLVRGVFEALPFRGDVFDGVMLGFSLRDAIDIQTSVSEVCRVLRVGGKMLVLEIGKPDRLLVRRMYGVFWKRIAPAIARVILGRRLKSNPWRWISPTYDSLPTNKELHETLKTKFREVKRFERCFGCLVRFLAEK